MELSALPETFERRSGAEQAAIHGACRQLAFMPPADYLHALQLSNGGEGLVGDVYFRLYSTDELVALNQAYQVAHFAPGLVLIGSNAGGEAFGFDLRTASLAIIRIPFVPLDFQYADVCGRSFGQFLSWLAASASEGSFPAPQAPRRGLELHEITPIVFGGSPTDPKNRALVPMSQHAELCVFWNGVYQRKVRARAGHSPAVA